MIYTSTSQMFLKQRQGFLHCFTLNRNKQTNMQKLDVWRIMKNAYSL